MKPRIGILACHPIQYLAPWFRELASRGRVSPRVFFCCDWGLREYTDPGFRAAFRWDIPLTDGYDHEFLPIASRPRRLSFLEVDNPRVGERLSAYGPDVVLVHGYARRTMWRAARWGRRNGVPSLLYSDSSDAHPRSLPVRILKSLVVGYFYRMMDGALCAGDNNRAYHRRYGVPEDRLFPWVLSVDVERFSVDGERRSAARRRVRERHGIRQDAFVVLFSGKLIPRKRPQDLLSAVSALKGTGVVALVVGAGELSGALVESAEGGRGPDFIRAGFVNQAEIPEYYAAADALCMPSERDAHPLVVSEAAAAGLPCILSDRVGCIGASDIARPGENALVYPCGDVDALRRCIGTLAADPRLAGRMGSRSGEIAREQTAEAAARLTEDAALRVLSDRGRNPAPPGSAHS